MKKFLSFAVIFIFFFVAFQPEVRARVRLPQIIASGMVLQREQPLTLWGWSEAQEKITLTFRGRKYRSQADSTGCWQVILPAQKPGGPFTMHINDTILTDVWVGDVILCSGQSNMELPLYRVVDFFGEEILSYENRAIRQLRVPTTYSFHGEEVDLPACRWQSLTRQTARDFSALAYFLARRLHDRFGVPVGIINHAVGGSTIESWLDAGSLQPFPDLQHTLALNSNDEYVQSVIKSERLRRRLWVDALNREDPGCGRWMADMFDDSHWERRSPFDLAWSRDADGRVINGSTWWRFHFDAMGVDTARTALLRLGCLVDADSVFVNGRFVGTTSYQYPPRKYEIPAGLLRRNSDNVVTVRLIGFSGVSSFVKEKPYLIEQEACVIPLDGEWLFCRGAVMPPLQGETFFMWQPTALYNTMMAPLGAYGVRAVVWYQGESNTGDTRRYAELLPILIHQWRSQLKCDDLPFVVVQLPEFMAERTSPSESGWAAMREVQRKVALEVPHVGLAVTLGTGEWNDIHPLDKKSVAQRVEAELLRLSYGLSAPSSPQIKSASFRNGTITLHFETNGSPLAVCDTLRGFAVAGDDGRFVWADTVVCEGDRVRLQTSLDSPRRVRYAWADNPGKFLLRNEEGVPASPFEIEVVSE